MEILTTILASLASISSLTSEVSVIGQIISMLENLIPLAIAEEKAVVPSIKNIITTLSANPATTADQLTSLKAFDAQTDADFDAAAAAAEAEDDSAT
jgi:hypothetical protein